MDYKIVFIPMIGGPGQFEQEFESIEVAEAALNAVANYTLTLHECSLLPDYANCGVLLRKDSDNEWVEIGADGEEI